MSEPGHSSAPDADRLVQLAEAIRRIESGEVAAEVAERHEEQELEQQARAVVLRKLAARARTRAELSAALVAKEIPEGIADCVLDRMDEVGLVDDEAFAKDWVASRQQRRHLSRRRLANELRQKGVDPGVIDEAVSGVAEDHEYEAALDLARRKLPSLARHDLPVQRRRLGGMLERRGFSGGLVHRVLRDVLEP